MPAKAIGRRRVRSAQNVAEPTAKELAAIERESALIDAEVALVDAEIRVLTAEAGPSVLDWRRLRRAEHRVTCELVALLARPVGPLRLVA